MSLATEHLAAADPVLGAFIARVGRLPPRPVDHAEPYEALLSAVAHQQLHAPRQERFWAPGSLVRRHLAHPRRAAGPGGQALRGCGFSASKMAALRECAANAADGTIPTRGQARRLADDGADLAADQPSAVSAAGRWRCC